MRKDSTLLVVETVMSDDPVASRAAKQLDFTMMIGMGGRERSAGEFGELLSRQGFALRRVIETSGAFHILLAAPAAP